ncbi:MAG TPA: YfhO family protein, partial [Candidatus Polarisedimenticolia bacterium]|nr:YfhO family protein [Candidatus Polarisedimenticolia bacterium]
GDRGRWGRAGSLAWLAAAAALLMIPCVVEGRTDARGAWLAATIVAGTTLLAALALLRPARASIYLIGVAGITCLDMFMFARGFNPHADPAALFPSTKLTDFVRGELVADPARGGRILTIGWTMRPETQMIYGLSSIEGYDAMEYAPYRRMLEKARVAEIHQTGEIPAESRALLNLTGVRFLLTPPGGVVSGDSIRLGYDGPDGRVFINEQASPRVIVVPRARGKDPKSALLDQLASGSLDPKSEILLESAPPTQVRDEETIGGAAPPPKMARDLPGDLLIDVEKSNEAAYLVISEAFDTGWRALVDGAPAEVLRANGSFMAVRLPPGSAEVALAYSPRSFTIGLWVSVICLLCLVTAGIAWRGGEAENGDERTA